MTSWTDRGTPRSTAHHGFVSKSECVQRGSPKYSIKLVHVPSFARQASYDTCCAKVLYLKYQGGHRMIPVVPRCCTWNTKAGTLWYLLCQGVVPEILRRVPYDTCCAKVLYLKYQGGHRMIPVVPRCCTWNIKAGTLWYLLCQGVVPEIPSRVLWYRYIRLLLCSGMIDEVPGCAPCST